MDWSEGITGVFNMTGDGWQISVVHWPEYDYSVALIYLVPDSGLSSVSSRKEFHGEGSLDEAKTWAESKIIRVEDI